MERDAEGARNMIYLHIRRTRLLIQAKDAHAAAPAGGRLPFSPGPCPKELAMRNFEKIGVVGAGMMGAEIALVFALAGHPTIISDQTREAADARHSAAARRHRQRRRARASGRRRRPRRLAPISRRSTGWRPTADAIS